jgi:BirA family biotin operon repressor/biotin-[acetyl-CoA-carboxylase] ligase
MLEIFDTLNSTNEYLKNKKDKKNFDGVLAHMQIEGRGTRGRKWFSNDGTLMFSFVIREDRNIAMTEYLKLPLVIGMALLKSLKELENLPFMFKWTNDIYLFDKKLSGILVEKVEDEFIVGIGINLNTDNFGELEDIATSIYSHTGRQYGKIEFAEEIIKNTKIYLSKFYHGEWEEILREINIYNYLKDKDIHFYSGGKDYYGRGCDIATDGSMTIDSSGKILKFQVGQATTIKKDIL